MIAAIHQPNYIPWLGYFYKIAKSDIFIIQNIVQFNKRGFTNRNRIKNPDGELWMTLPVERKGIISEIKLKNNIDWRNKHLQYLRGSYRKANYFDEYMEDLIRIYSMEWEYMYEFNIELIKYIMEKLNIKTKTIYASSLNVEGKSTELLIDVCKKTGADTYLSGLGGKNYMDESKFAEEGIRLIYSDFQHPVYPQLWGDFIPNMSIVDLLFNCGGDSLEYILHGGRHG